MPPAATVACVVVPQGTHRPDAIAAAVAAHQPEWSVVALWCGDPQLQPSTNGVAWFEPAAAVDEVALVASDPHTWEWHRSAVAVAELLRDGASNVVLLWAGSVAVLGCIEPLTAASTGLTLVPRAVGPLGHDELAPGEADLIDAGPFSSTVAAITSAAVADWIVEVTRSAPTARMGAVLARAAFAFAARSCEDDSIGASVWRWPTGRVALLDVPTFDPRAPWVLDPGIATETRVRVVGLPERESVVATALAQLAGERRPLTLPGGIAVDHVVRGIVRDEQMRAPRPWSDAPEFRRWLAPRYWPALHSSRHDLAAAFPDPLVRDRDAYAEWSSGAFARDAVPFLLGTARDVQARLRVAEALRPDGVNLVGYLTREASLGDVARRLLTGLRAARVPVSTIATERTASPPLAGAEQPDQRVEFDTSLAVVTADQFHMLVRDHPELFRATRRMIGYWFWELEHVPEHMRAAIRFVDEIWAGSRFVTDAFAAVSRVPVRHVPIPVPAPVAAEVTRSAFAPLADVGDRFVFLVAFDHLSVTERKNPLGAIAAFRRAFAPGEGPLLVIKTMNGSKRWNDHQRIVAAARDRSDVIVWDAHLARSEQMALVRCADCLVSLHRSEGLGLHLAEAMWLGTPTIATRYSGNVDFMDDTCALLVGYDLVPVEHGEGVYPRTARWAEPDVEQAADAMRRLASDRALHGRLAVAARARMNQQPTLRDTGALVASLLR